ncbi:MAG: toll/interleukin-1 receptor domain-containing protein [Candidatus Competibacteraceae bacterium]|nr:toll/interleukin-1 receptor domain-containing protein [Candidatus Competibacteraceae bacterium]
MENTPNKPVFISYSHRDARWLKRLQTHLRPLERGGKVQPWDDTHLRAGDDWRQGIEKALGEARVAVLLISADFLASDFIHEVELPRLLAGAEGEGTVILPLILSPCLFRQMPELARFQAVNSPDRPLSDLSRGKQEAVLVDLARRIGELVG